MACHFLLCVSRPVSQNGAHSSSGTKTTMATRIERMAVKFACPRCSHEVGLRDRACPKCKLALTLGGVVGYYWGLLCSGVKKEAVIQCPGCHRPVPLATTVCPHPNCGAPITVGATVDAVMAPTRRRWRGFLDHATPTTRRWVQLAYLILSATILWWLLAYVEKHHSGNWIWHALLSVLYLTVFGIVAALVAPRRVFEAIASHASWSVKLALVFNYLTLLLLLQVMISTWWARAVMLAGFFGATYLAVWLLRKLLLPMFSGEAEDRTFDPSAAQGRRGRYD